MHWPMRDSENRPASEISEEILLFKMLADVIWRILLNILMPDIDSSLTQYGAILRLYGVNILYLNFKTQRMKSIISTLAVALVLFTSCSSVKNVQEPEYRDIQNIRIIDLGILQSTAGVDLVYYNPNSFGVQVSEARGDVYLDNAYLGRFSLAHKVQVGKRSEFVVPAVIKLDMIGAIKNQREIFKKKEAMIRIDGMARVTKAGFSRDIPIKFESMENLEKFRGLVSR
jgi:LEA14-like dessication related protein